MKTITISASVPMFDYSQLTIETRIRVQQLETEILTKAMPRFRF